MKQLGIIGCGVIAQFHLRAAQKLTDARVAVVADVREDAARTTAESFGIPRWVTDAEEVFADPSIDGVVLALPTALRFGLGCRALAAGKHVLTEKPVAMNAGQVEELIRRKGDRVVACCSSRYRFNPISQQATEFIRSGRLGSLRAVRIRGINGAGAPPVKPPPVWRLRKDLNGGGILVNWGCYDLDYLLGILDWKVRPLHVLARAWPVSPGLEAYQDPSSDAETHVNFTATLEGGALLQYERSEFSLERPGSAWSILGDHGCLHLDMLAAGNGRLVWARHQPGEGTVEEVLAEGGEDEISPHEGPLHNFVDCLHGRAVPATSLEQAWLVARLTDSVYASVALNQPVAFGPRPSFLS